MKYKKSPKILLIDDSISIRKMYKFYLGNSGKEFSIVEAENAMDGIALYEQEKPDCIVLDFVLPDGNGLEIIRKLKKNHLNTHLPIVLATSYGNEQLIIDAIQAGAQDYINKEKLTQEALLVAIDNTMERVDMLNTVSKRLFELENFSRIISQDLNNPLSSINGLLHLLQKENQHNTNPKFNGYIDKAIDCCGHMHDMIQDLHNYCNIQVKRDPFTAFQSGDAIKAAVDNLQMLITKNNASIEVTSSFPNIMAAKNLFVQIITNLIQNAIKYCDQTPRIELSCEEESDYYIFAVKDNGLGIKPENFQKIFDVFERGEMRSHTYGSGLGLSICKKIAGLHLGEIWVESEVGKGSTFFFSIQKDLPKG